MVSESLVSMHHQKVYLYPGRVEITNGMESMAPTTAAASQSATAPPPPNTRTEYVSS